MQVAADRDFSVDFVIAFDGKTKQTNQTNVFSKLARLPLLCHFGLDLNMRKVRKEDVTAKNLANLADSFIWSLSDDHLQAQPGPVAGLQEHPVLVESVQPGTVSVLRQRYTTRP